MRNLVEQVAQLRPHLTVRGVLALWTVEGDRDDAGVAVHQDGFGHESKPYRADDIFQNALSITSTVSSPRSIVTEATANLRSNPPGDGVRSEPSFKSPEARASERKAAAR